ncbi:MAG: hypothetical protein KGJ93_02765 [Patescibacteria group bacterium]|nr:hypothetical protein [Patescibacteria group bacterium]
MKKYLIVAAIVLLAAACNKAMAPQAENPSQFNQQPTVAPDSAADWQTYRNLDYGFEFKYPSDFAFTQPTYGGLKQEIVQLRPAKNFYSGTNYVDSAFTVSNDYVSKPAQCFLDSAGKTLTSVETINGTKFYTGENVGAAAGNLYNSVIYRTLNKDWCTEITLTVHTGNIANYPAGSVTEVDQNKPLAVLRQMLSTFTFSSQN